MENSQTIITLTSDGVTASIVDSGGLTAYETLYHFAGLMKAHGFQEKSIANALQDVADEYIEY
jgi:hypothetical protein